MRKFGLVIITALIAAATSQAATLALWENDNILTPVRSNAVDTVDADVSAGHLELGPTVALPAEQWENSLNAYAWDGASNLTTAVSSGQYFSFSVTPGAGKQVDYAEIFARVSLSDKNDDGASVQVVLMSSSTGFTVGDELGSFVASTLPGEVTITTNNYDVSGIAALQDNPSEVVFRLYYFTSSGNAGRLAFGHTFWLDSLADVSVDGVVEEATTLPVVALAAWNNDDLAGTETNNAVYTEATGISAGDLAQSYRWFNELAPWPRSLWALCSDLPEVTNLVTAITEDRYYSFTVTPDAQKVVDYKNVAARITLNSAGNVGTSVTLVLMSSITGFTDGDEIGSFVAVHDIADENATDNGLIGMDISGVAALQDITAEVEFRLYVILNDTTSNRLGFGHIFGPADDADDVLVQGTIDDIPVPDTLPADIISLTHFSSTVMKMVVDAPSAADSYYPVSKTDLVTGGTWTEVAHSDDGSHPFMVTNLSYSTAEGTNEVIYVQSTDVQKFFEIWGD